MVEIIGQGDKSCPTTWSKKKNGKYSNFGILDKAQDAAAHFLESQYTPIIYRVTLFSKLT